MLRPLGKNILIKPEANEETTESGLILVEHRKPETMGTVIAVGPCPHPLKDEAEEAASALTQWGSSCGDVDFKELFLTSAEILRSATAKEPLVKAGDLVVFPWTAGREVQIDDTGDRYLLMTEDDLLAVIEQ